jgi:hypothetical protein
MPVSRQQNSQLFIASFNAWFNVMEGSHEDSPVRDKKLA